MKFSEMFILPVVTIAIALLLLTAVQENYTLLNRPNSRQTITFGK